MRYALILFILLLVLGCDQNEDMNAPVDLYAAMGKNGQFIDVVPSKGLVVIRMGEALDNSLVPAAFHNQMWERIMAVTGG